MKNILKYWGYGVLALGLFFLRHIGKWIANVVKQYQKISKENNSTKQGINVVAQKT